MQPRWLSASVAMADSDYAINHVIHSLCLDVYARNTLANLCVRLRASVQINLSV